MTWLAVRRRNRLDLSQLRRDANETYLYLQARGFLVLTMGNRVSQYRTILGQQGRAVPSRWQWLRQTVVPQLGKNLLATAVHLPTAIGRSLWQILARTLLDTVRTAPPMLAVVILLLFTSDTWKTFGNEPITRVIGILFVVLVASVALFFANARRFGDGRRPPFLPTTEEIYDLARRTPARGLVDANVVPQNESLSRAAVGNLWLIYVLLIGMNFLMVGLSIAVTLMLFGILVFNRAEQADLLGTQHVHVLFSFSTHGSFVFSWQLMLVSFMLAGVAVLYFAAAGLADKEARANLVGPNLDDLRSCVSAFYYYQGAVAKLEE